MNYRNPIPPLLSPYICLPPSTSLILLTSTLSTSTNWLVLRYLYHYLRSTGASSRSAPRGQQRPQVQGLEREVSRSVVGGETGGRRREEEKEDAGGDSDDSETRRSDHERERDEDDDEIAVVLVSFLKDLDFWRGEMGRMGIDPARLSRTNRFRFVDGLTSLFSNNVSVTASASKPPPAATAARPAREALRHGYSASGVGGSSSSRGETPAASASPARGFPREAATPERTSQTTSTSTTSTTATTLRSSRLDHIRETILQEISRARNSLDEYEPDPSPQSGAPAVAQYQESEAPDGRAARKKKIAPVVLIIDGLDFLLAATASSGAVAGSTPKTADGECSIEGMQRMVFALREQVHSTVIALSADTPLLRSHLDQRHRYSHSTAALLTSAAATPLETNHASMMIALAHQARFIVSLRPLKTGVARDVSGVIRITRGAYADEDDSETDSPSSSTSSSLHSTPTPTPTPAHTTSYYPAHHQRTTGDPHMTQDPSRASHAITTSEVRTKKTTIIREKVKEMECLYFVGAAGTGDPGGSSSSSSSFSPPLSISAATAGSRGGNMRGSKADVGGSRAATVGGNSGANEGGSMRGSTAGISRGSAAGGSATVVRVFERGAAGVGELGR